MEDRVWHVEEAAREPDPTFIAAPIPQDRDGESSHTLRGERRDFVVDAIPILHEKPKFKAFQEFSPFSKENATQEPPGFKKGSRMHDLGADNHPAMLHRFGDHVSRQSTVRQPNQCT
jgi:hypothetical protein